MIRKLFEKVVGDPNEKALKKAEPLVEEVNRLEAEYEGYSDEALRDQTEEFRRQIAEAVGAAREELEELKEMQLRETDPMAAARLREEISRREKDVLRTEEEILEEMMPRAFAAVREAAKRTIGLRHYDVQVVGGLLLHQGNVVEMRTGEGKTLVATMPVYLNALAGRGVHVVTVNDYLAKRDAQWMGPIYQLLGVSVGVIQSAGGASPDQASYMYDPNFVSPDDRYQNLRPITRKEAYAADITYGTNNEFGFDYLRDNMVYDLENVTQRGLHYAIIDEVDNVLIDEARTPLIISGMSDKPSEYYRKFAQLVRRLQPEVDYKVEERERIVTLTESGVSKIEKWLGIDNLYSPEYFELTPYLDNALRAHVLYKRDKDYIVKDNQVIIVDEFTGRLMLGRRYAEGLHQAIEAKEGVRVQRESLTMATITFQNYFRMYQKLAGMTGTAATEKEEFAQIYDLDVVVLPTNIEYMARQGKLVVKTEKRDGVEVVTYHDPKDPSKLYFKRVDYPDMVYKTQRAKFDAVVREIEELYRQGRPVLVGTVAIETSEFLSSLLDRHGIPHQVLNAKYHEKEAQIIAQAGRPGAVTIATNMAGRGVDILLGGNPEGLARDQLRKEGFDLTTIRTADWDEALKILRAGGDPTERFHERWAEVLAEKYALCKEDHVKVWKMGGLHVLGTEHHEARRIDNQLRGRAGRQGDPGSSRFYVSLEDELMRRFGGESVSNLMDKLGIEEDMPIEHGMVTKAIANAQVKVEGYNFDIRKHVLEYDDVVNKQREVIYNQRRRILRENMKPTILRMVEEELERLVNSFAAGRDPELWDLEGLYDAVKAMMPLPPDESPRSWQGMSAGQILDRLIGLAHEVYEAKEAELGEEGMRKLERAVMLKAVDERWVRHLTDLDALREGIGLRAFANIDPLVAYKKEAHEMYQALLQDIEHDIVYTIYHVTLKQPPQRRVRQVRAVHPSAGGDGGGRTAQRRTHVGDRRMVPPYLGRNDPCWCGSGKKYKYCHMDSDLRGETAPPWVRGEASAQEPVPAGAGSISHAGAGKPTKKKRRRKRKH